MKKINGFDIGLVLVIAAIFLLFRFANARNNQQEIENIKVKFTSTENNFLTQQMVNNLLKQNFSNPSVIAREALDLRDSEHKLDINSWVAHSEVYVDISGQLNAEVEQKTPLARVMMDGMSYYLGSKGDTIPLSSNFSARVPLINGVLKAEYKQDFMRVLQAITKDEMMKEMITGVKINPDQSLHLTSRAHDATIEFGKMTEIEKKITNYKVFMHHIKNDTMMQQYKNINLRFTEQVICTKQ